MSLGGNAYLVKTLESKDSIEVLSEEDARLEVAINTVEEAVIDNGSSPGNVKNEYLRPQLHYSTIACYTRGDNPQILPQKSKNFHQTDTASPRRPLGS